MEEYLKKLLIEMVERNASDIYLTVARPPTLRIHDVLEECKNSEPLTLDLITQILENTLTEAQYERFRHRNELNISFGIEGMGRFRVNVLKQRENPAIVIRAIKRDIPKFEELGLPVSLRKQVMNKRGIVLLCGMTGSGKSTTLASMIDYRNEQLSGHIITIEDPIEYLHKHKKSIVTQREVGVDTENYHVALKNTFRQKPDVILIGEVRDRYVMEQALVAAETGHLCLSTIHANNSYQAIERILNFFEENQYQQVRSNLAMNLRVIISQRLIPAKNGGRVLAYEVMLNEGYIKELILKGEIGKIREIMNQNEPAGMVTFDQTLLKLYREGKITEEVALLESDYPVDMELQLKQANVSGHAGLTDIDTGEFYL